MSDTSDMVLRVAVAIATRRDAFGPGEKLAAGYLDDARAAIAAMREPTEARIKTDTSEMIERCARGLAFLNCSDQAEADHCWRNYIDDARCVIEDMREPTEAMLDKAGPPQKWGRDALKASWHDMIDAALR